VIDRDRDADADDDVDGDVDVDGYVVFATGHPTALLTHLEYFFLVSSWALPTIYESINIILRTIPTKASDLPMDAAASTGGRANSQHDVLRNGLPFQSRAKEGPAGRIGKGKPTTVNYKASVLPKVDIATKGGRANSHLVKTFAATTYHTPTPLILTTVGRVGTRSAFAMMMRANSLRSKVH